MRRPGPLLALLLSLLVACPAQRAYHDAVSLEEAGRATDAADRYLDALDASASHARARRGLEQVAQPAYEARLGAAARAERDTDFEQALERYTALQRYLGRLHHHEALSFDVSVDVDAKVAQMASSAADRERLLGDKSAAAGRWSQAVDHYQAALVFQPGDDGLRRALGYAWSGWGDDDVQAGRYRDGAARFVEASALGDAAATRRGAEVFAALGRHHLAEGACRQAVRDLQSARNLLSGVLDDDLASAWACAETRVVVARPGGTRREVAGVDVVGRLHAALLDGLPRETSTFVSVVDESALAEGPRRPDGTPVAHFLVAGNLVTAGLESTGPVDRERTTVGEVDWPCADDRGATCPVDRDVRYTEVSEDKIATVSAALRLVALPGRSVVQSRTFDGVSRDGVRYAHGFYDAITGQALDLGRVALDPDIEALEGATGELASDAELVRRAVALIAADATRWLAPQLDREDEWEDPTAVPIVAVQR